MRLRRYRDPAPGHDPIPLPAVVKGWSTEYLFQRLARARNHQPYQEAVIESELRVREAWRTPDTWSMAISLVAMLVSVAALIVTVFANR
jgi:hypothetical protein